MKSIRQEYRLPPLRRRSASTILRFLSWATPAVAPGAIVGLLQLADRRGDRVGRTRFEACESQEPSQAGGIHDRERTRSSDRSAERRRDRDPAAILAGSTGRVTDT